MSDGFAALLSAIDQGEPQALAALKSHEIHVQALNDHTNGELVLRAVRGGNVEIVRWLLKSGLRPTSFPQAVLEAVLRDRFKIALLLLRLPMDVNVLDANGWSLLHHAAHKGDKKLVSMLLEKGADPVATTPDGMTPLLIAIFQKKEDVGRLLVEAGVDVETPWRSYTPLMHAAHIGAPTLARALLERGAGFYVTLEENGWDALLIATAQNHLPMVELLVAHGADIDVKDHQGYTPLFIAVNSGFKEIALHLVQNRASVNEPANDGMTPLWVAIHKNEPEMARILLTVDVDVEVKGGDGTTPLLFATAAGYEEIVGALLEKGADLKATSVDGRTALVIAEDKPNLLKLFAQYSPELSQEQIRHGATGPLPDLSTDHIEEFVAAPTFIGVPLLSRAEVRRRSFIRFTLAALVVGALVIGGLWAYITFFAVAPVMAPEEPAVVKLAPSVASIGAPVKPEPITALEIEGSSSIKEHPIEALIDGEEGTSWRALAPKEEKGEEAEAPTITLKWSTSRRVHRLRLMSGAEVPAKGHRLLRIQEVEIKVEGGEPIKATLEDRGDWQTLPLDHPRITSTLEIRPLTFYKPIAAVEPAPKKTPKKKKKRRWKPKPKFVDEIILAEIEIWAEPAN